MRVTILDGYVDEPGCLGVPPYISPYPRYAAGAALASGAEVTYVTIDEYRSGSRKLEHLAESDVVLVIAGALVPGKYLRGRPASGRELAAIARGLAGTGILGGPLASFGEPRGSVTDRFDLVVRRDIDAALFDLLSGGEPADRRRTPEEGAEWAGLGAGVIGQHPDAWGPLIAEVQLGRGCVRHFTGGCSFCTEPLYGEPEFRPVEEVIREVEALGKAGAVNFRLTASCVFTYHAEGVGETETPRPRPEVMQELLMGIQKSVPELSVLHTDNANPAVMAEHPAESREVLKLLVEHCTGGNVLALGMESADPEVMRANNLNATPEQVREAVGMINEMGAGRGETGLPRLLPGINILAGLRAETGDTFDLNFEFLRGLMDAGLLLRRLNIRQVASHRASFNTKKRHGDFVRFKKRVREKIDRPMLERIAPSGTVLKGVFMEKAAGATTFGRQAGTYPLLVGIPYRLDPGARIDVIVTDHGFRSLTGIQYPMDPNDAPISALACVPGIGKKRAARLFRARPIRSAGELVASLDDGAEPDRILPYFGYWEGKAR